MLERFNSPGYSIQFWNGLLNRNVLNPIFAGSFLPGKTWISFTVGLWNLYSKKGIVYFDEISIPTLGRTKKEAEIKGSQLLNHSFKQNKL